MNSFRLLVTALAVPMFLAAQPGFAQEGVSLWASEQGARVRLISGGLGADGAYRAGIEIRLDPGWKTYWLNPGPTGVRPRIDTAGSLNLAGVEDAWPAPMRFSDGGTDSVGYSEVVIIPLSVLPRSTGHVLLKLAFEYGLCKDICIPARADLELELVDGALLDIVAAEQLKSFTEKLPKPAKLGAKAPFSIMSAAKTRDGLGVDVKFPETAKVKDLFASAPGTTVGVPSKTVDGLWRIRLRAGPAPEVVELLAVADGEAIKVPVALDDLPTKP